MQVKQIVLKFPADISPSQLPMPAFAPDLVLAFGSVAFFGTQGTADALRSMAPDATIAGCSTAGEIAFDRVYDNMCVVTCVKFKQAQAKAVSAKIARMEDSIRVGQQLADQLPKAGLTAILLFGVGVAINGSALVAGLQSGVPQGVTISGGLAADGGAFKRTWTLGPLGAADDQVVAVGLYGDSLRLAYGSYAGWEPFGPSRKVTRCRDNVLYELDGTRALEIYKSYLGTYAKDLPGSGLLFPFEMLSSTHEKSGIFRSILGVDEADGSLTLAGDVDPNGYLRLMHSSTDRLIQGAETAAAPVAAARKLARTGDSGLAILVSCIGRKLVMGDRVDEEVEAVANLLGPDNTIAGFYANGEIGASTLQGDCRLHNQTMTITLLSEA